MAGDRFFAAILIGLYLIAIARLVAWRLGAPLFRVSSGKSSGETTEGCPTSGRYVQVELGHVVFLADLGRRDPFQDAYGDVANLPSGLFHARIINRKEQH